MKQTLTQAVSRCSLCRHDESDGHAGNGENDGPDDRGHDGRDGLQSFAVGPSADCPSDTKAYCNRLPPEGQPGYPLAGGQRPTAKKFISSCLNIPQAAVLRVLFLAVFALLFLLAGQGTRAGSPQKPTPVKPQAAQARPPKPRPPSRYRRLFLLLCDGLTLQDIRLADASIAPLTWLAENGATGLMNCAVTDPRTDAAALLTMATGQITASDPKDETAANDWEKTPGEKLSAGQSYRMRMGLPKLAPDRFDPIHSVKHLAIRSLSIRGLNAIRLGSLLAAARPPVRAAVVGNADTTLWKRRAAILTVDARGVGSGMIALRSYDAKCPYGLTDNPQALVAYGLAANADFTVLQMGDGARAEAARAKLTEAEYRTAHLHFARNVSLLVYSLVSRLKAAKVSADILLVAPRPPSASAAHPEDWNHLTPIIGYGTDFPPGTLTSPTTRTSGVVSNTDVAPTVLNLLHLPVPTAMTGRAMRDIPEPALPNEEEAIPPYEEPPVDAGSGDEAPKSEGEALGPDRLQRLARIDHIAYLNSITLVPVLVTLGGFCSLCALAGLIALRFRRPQDAERFAVGFIFVLNFPAALLLAPLLAPGGLPDYMLRIGAVMLALTVVSFWVAIQLQISPPLAACAINVLIVMADLLTGQHLIRNAVISNYYLPGFRYYGIGNDYLGILLGLTLAGGFSLVDDWNLKRREGAGRMHAASHAEETGPRIPPRRLTFGIMLAWISIAAILGWPGFGANAGSLVATGAGYGSGWWALRGRRHAWLVGIVFGLIGLAASFGFAFLDGRLHGGDAAHAGMALRAAAAGRGYGYLLGIMQRKLLFNFSLLASPWTWVSGCLIGGVILLAPMLAEDRVETLKQHRVWLHRAWTPIYMAAAASLLFKDSGIAAVCYLIGFATTVRLFYLFTESSKDVSPALAHAARASDAFHAGP